MLYVGQTVTIILQAINNHVLYVCHVEQVTNKLKMGAVCFLLGKFATTPPDQLECLPLQLR